MDAALFDQVNMLMNTGQGLAIEKSLSKFDVKVLAAETRKQVIMLCMRVY